MSTTPGSRVVAWSSLFPAHLWRFPLLVFVFTRLGFLASSYMGLKLVPELFMHAEDRRVALQPYPAIDGLCRWDCGWFDRVIRLGFHDPEHAKVFPLFPWLAQGLAKVTGMHHLVALLVIANVAALLAYVLIYRLFRNASTPDGARFGLLLFVSYPFSFFHAAAYSESLMAFFSALAITLALEKRHALAGVVLGLGLLSRHVTLFAGAALVAAQLRQSGFSIPKLVWNRAILTLGLPFLFLAAWAAYLGILTGDPLAFWRSRSIGWGPSVFWGIATLIDNSSFDDRPEYWFYAIFGIIPLMGSLCLWARRSWMELAAAATVLMAVCIASGGVCFGRYASSIWPAFLPLGVWLARRPTWAGPVVASLWLWQGLYFYLFSHQFRII